LSTDDSDDVVSGTRDASLPHARTAGLVVQGLGDESLVFDRDCDVAHCLGPPAAAVWRACDGTHDVSALAACTGIDVALVGEVLDELELKGLLAGAAPPVSGPAAVSRRSALRRLAIAGLAATPIPLIVSATIAAPLAHASGGSGVICDKCTPGSSDSCGPGLVCDATSMLCIPDAGCSFLSCTPGMPCGGQFFPGGMCQAGCSTAGTLCCA
jgi:hypothetical protein